jgi:hypothetical protein
MFNQDEPSLEEKVDEIHEVVSTVKLAAFLVGCLILLMGVGSIVYLILQAAGVVD